MSKKDKAKEPNKRGARNENRKNGKASKKGCRHRKNPQDEIRKILNGDGSYVNVAKRWAANA